MEFKVVLYIIIGVFWVIFNNYQKIKNQAAERDISKPPAELKPMPSNGPTVLTKSAPKPTVSQNPSRTSTTGLAENRKTMVKNVLGSRTRTSTWQNTILEGGSIKPSTSVQFADVEAEGSSLQNPIAEQIRNADFRQAIVLSVILQRPNY